MALSLPRTPDLLVTVLAVLKAGAAFVSVDPAYPPPRVAFMLADSRPSLLVTTSAIAGALQADAAALPRLLLDAEDTTHRLGREASDNLTDGDRISPLLPDHPVHVFYTSGSTGVPKGVVASRGGLGCF